jgi:hypothetical protein
MPDEDLPPVLENQTAINTIMDVMGYKTKARSCSSCRFFRMPDRKSVNEPLKYFCGLSLAFVLPIIPDGVCRHWNRREE